MSLTPDQAKLFEEFTALKAAWVDRGARVNDVLTLLTMELASIASEHAVAPSHVMSNFARAYSRFMLGKCEPEPAVFVLPESKL